MFEGFTEKLSSLFDFKAKPTRDFSEQEVSMAAVYNHAQMDLLADYTERQITREEKNDPDKLLEVIDWRINGKDSFSDLKDAGIKSQDVVEFHEGLSKQDQKYLKSAMPWNKDEFVTETAELG